MGLLLIKEKSLHVPAKSPVRAELASPGRDCEHSAMGAKCLSHALSLTQKRIDVMLRRISQQNETVHPSVGNELQKCKDGESFLLPP